jgi:hypothetical protein
MNVTTDLNQCFILSLTGFFTGADVMCMHEWYILKVQDSSDTSNIAIIPDKKEKGLDGGSRMSFF